MNAKLYRMPSTNLGTPGMLQVFNDLWNMVGAFTTGELPWVNNLPMVSCVPPGKYMVDWVETPKHPTGIYMLQGVPDRTDCEMHNGNYFGSVANGYRSDVDGCILVAQGFGILNGQLAVVESDLGLAAFNNLMGKAPFELEIIDGGNLLPAS